MNIFSKILAWFKGLFKKEQPKKPLFYVLKKPGVKVFSYNKETGILAEEGDKVVINKKCVYVRARDEKNALRKALKLCSENKTS